MTVFITFFEGFNYRAKFVPPSQSQYLLQICLCACILDEGIGYGLLFSLALLLIYFPIKVDIREINFWVHK